ncbi:MAG: hypothetical protein AAGI92_07275 [Pseudomonadota bacterium]
MVLIFLKFGFCLRLTVAFIVLIGGVVGPSAAQDLTVPPPEPFQLITPETSSDSGDVRGGPAPIVSSDLDQLPAPVRTMREQLIKAAKSGEIEALRPLLQEGAEPTQLSLADIDGDPIEFLKSMSGDTQGHEMLAILLDVLDLGYAHLDRGEPTEIFVWPYFVSVDLEMLTSVQRVELFRLVTATDYEEMRAFGAYIFFRVGITPDGAWRFFVAGD